MINLSTGAFFDRATQQIGDLRGQAAGLQDQVGTGQRLSRSSDDPVAAARLRTLARSDRLGEFEQRNSDAAMSDLRLVDTALGTMANIVTRARELTLQAATEAQGPEQRALLRAELDALRDSLLTVANSRNVAGHALFGGQSAGMAYQSVGPTIAYSGTAAPARIDIGDGQSVASGFAGPEVLSFEQAGVTTDLFAVIGNLSAALQNPAADPVAAAQLSLDGLEGGLDRITTAQAITGARMGWIEIMDTRRQEVGDLVASERQEIGGADLATTMVRLQETLTVLEASQASFVKLASLSLFNSMR